MAIVCVFNGMFSTPDVTAWGEVIVKGKSKRCDDMKMGVDVFKCERIVVIECIWFS